MSYRRTQPGLITAFRREPDDTPRKPIYLSARQVLMLLSTTTFNYVIENYAVGEDVQWQLRNLWLEFEAERSIAAQRLAWAASSRAEASALSDIGVIDVVGGNAEHDANGAMS